MVDHIKIRSADGTWVVRAGGAVLAESHNALELSEGDYKPVIYFPREDIAMAFLDASDRTNQDQYKGEARYFSIVTKSKTLTDAAWSFEAPSEGMERIKDHVAFNSNGPDIAVEQV